MTKPVNKHVTPPQSPSPAGRRVERNPEIIESFAAVLMRTTLEHRGDFGADLVSEFAQRIADELLRYERKPAVTVNQLRMMHSMANSIVARAMRAGRVLAYEPKLED
jgi:hypothetical protein